MNEKIIAYDLGTGGIKASLYNKEGNSLESTFLAYDTYFPKENYHEQRPEDWWNAIIATSKALIEKTKVNVNEIIALAISGHSLGVVPIGKDGSLLKEYTPIWSDKRAVDQSQEFFKTTDYEKWYLKTGSGFPSECYSIFKMMWYRETDPEMYEKIDKVIGTKDYCNYKFTGRLCTDYSYASGSGVFDLENWEYIKEYVEASGINPGILPEIIESHGIVGNITEEASQLTGLPTTVKVIAGGVDNSCMALGARGIENGRVYTSLGTSAWIALTSDKPVVDFKTKPYVFAHVIKGMYASATSIFSAGNSYKWVRDNLCGELYEAEKNGGEDAYSVMDKMAEQSPIGSNKIIFNPSLGGGSMIEESPNICGAFTGLRLSTTKNDLIRSTLEGITMNLGIALRILEAYHTETLAEMLIVGGGSKSSFWRQIFADVYGLDMIKSKVDQDAASLGAAALAAVGVGLWNDYKKIDELHEIEATTKPISENVAQYKKLLPIFTEVAGYMAKTGDRLNELSL